MHPLLLLVGVITLCNAHHMITNIHINGIDQGDGTCVRVPPNTNPLVDVKAAEMACNVGGERALDKFSFVDAGAPITLEWRTWPDGSVKTPVDVSHQGPCSVYMKKVDAFTDQAAGAGWFKIWHYGFENGVFCTEVLRKNAGMMKVTIPKDLEGGRYLLRGEHIALHQAQTLGGAQFFIGCIQVVVYSTGGSARPRSISIPGHVNANDPGILFDYWNNMTPKSYIVPGPAPYIPTNAGGGNQIFVNYQKKYPTCLVSNADWCAVSVPSFNNEESCYKSVANCWDQLDACYNKAPATGHRGCTAYEATCQSYQNYCQECGEARSCSGSFYNKLLARMLQARAEHRDPLLPPIPKRSVGTIDAHRSHKRILRRKAQRDATADVVSTSQKEKLNRARTICDQIAAKCREDGIGGLCKVFGAACRGALAPNVIEQFPEKSDRKWQALWLYQIACENENFNKDECRERFSRALWEFE